jgi:hypothetical protein
MLAAPMAFSIAVIAFARGNHTAEQLDLPGPSQWIPFTAVVTITVSGDDLRVVGRFFRASDGSTRIETKPAEHEGDPLVSINNVSEATSYRGRGNKWTAAPMDIAPGEWRPRKFRAGAPFLSVYRYKLRLGRGEGDVPIDGALTASSGLDAYQMLNGSGTVMLLVPSLNFFPVVRQTLAGRREVYSEISQTEPDPSLFKPPLGVIVTQLSESRGIVRMERPW